MEKFQETDKVFYEWPCQPASQEENPRGNRQVKKTATESKQSQESMIRSLQGVFCKGRYRSWVFSREK